MLIWSRSSAHVNPTKKWERLREDHNLPNWSVHGMGCQVLPAPGKDSAGYPMLSQSEHSTSPRYIPWQGTGIYFVSFVVLGTQQMPKALWLNESVSSFTTQSSSVKMWSCRTTSMWRELNFTSCCLFGSLENYCLVPASIKYPRDVYGAFVFSVCCCARYEISLSIMRILRGLITYYFTMPRASLDDIYPSFAIHQEPQGLPFQPLGYAVDSEEQQMSNCLRAIPRWLGQFWTYCIYFSNCHLLGKSDFHRIGFQLGLLCSTDEGRFGGLEKEQRDGEFFIHEKSLTFATPELRCLRMCTLSLTNQ